MTKASENRAKVDILKEIEGVDSTSILKAIDDCKENLYDYFVKSHAIGSGYISSAELNDFVMSVYGDFYFLHKGKAVKTELEKEFFGNAKYNPQNLPSIDSLAFLQKSEYQDILPISISTIDAENDNFYICVDSGRLYNLKDSNTSKDARIYLNLPCGNVCEFAKEFLHQCYMNNICVKLNILNNDYRNDTIVIYADFGVAKTVLGIIKEIKSVIPSLFEKCGAVCDLLGKMDGFIGFGEQSGNDKDYIKNRCLALRSIKSMAENRTLKNLLLKPEEENILYNGEKITLKKYILAVLKKSAQRKVGETLKNIDESISEKDIQNSLVEFNDTDELKKFTRTLTRGGNYMVLVNGQNTNVDILPRIYFKVCKKYKYQSPMQKGFEVAKNLYNLTSEFLGNDTHKFLFDYFKCELSESVKREIDEQLEKLKTADEKTTLRTIRMRACLRLNMMLGNIIDETADGKEMVEKCITDYLRILDDNTLENVKLVTKNHSITIVKDVTLDILSLYPNILDATNVMAENTSDIAKILRLFDINPDNIAISCSSQNIHKEETKDTNVDRKYYYNPEGYLSK